MKLIKETIELPEVFSASLDVEEKRATLIAESKMVVAVENPEQQQTAVSVGREIQTWCKKVEDARQVLTKPLLDSQRLIKSLADEHCKPLLAERDRIKKLVDGFQAAEARRAAEEERKRQDEIRRLEAEKRKLEEANAPRVSQVAGIPSRVIATENQLRAAVIAGPVKAAKESGATTKKVMRFEVTDIRLLVQSRPDLCRIEPNALAIKSSCVPEMPNIPPGLKLWWETETSFRSY